MDALHANDSQQYLRCRVEPVVRIGTIEGEKKPFVEFEANLTLSSGEVRSLWFRYSTLRPIDQLLRKRLKSGALPEFPSKILFRRETDPEVIEERRLELNAYLHYVVPQWGGNDEALDAWLAHAIPKIDFFLPRQVGSLPAAIMVNGAELWIGPVLETTYQSLQLLVALKTKLNETARVEEKLGLLELNSQRANIASEQLEANLPAVREAFEAGDSLPRDTLAYMQQTIVAGTTAIQWHKGVEARILSNLDDGGFVGANNYTEENAESDETSGREYPGRVIDVERDNDGNQEDAPLLSFRLPNDSSLDDASAVAERLVAAMLGAEEGPEKGRLLAARESLLLSVGRMREQSDEPEAWRDVQQYVERHAVFSPSLHAALTRLEGELYALVDRRAQLRQADVRVVSQVRRDVINLRRVLRQLKERMQSEKDMDHNDPALMADLNTVTDLQENCSLIQIDIEANFEYDANLEDIVSDRLQQRLVEETSRQHAEAQDSIFDL